MAAANVMLRIGAAFTGAKDIQAAMQMLGGMYNKIKELATEMDRFSTVMRQTNMEIVNFADSAAKGQIDTFELMKSLERLSQAGLEVTKEQFKSLAINATNLAQATGQDATEAFKRLTTGIAKGSSRALTEYGIKLKESTNLTETQTAAMKALTERSKGMSVDIDKVSERMSALDNNVGTLKGLLWDGIAGSGSSLGGALDRVNDELGQFNKTLSEMPAAARETYLSIETLTSAATAFFTEIGNAITGADESGRAFFNWIKSTRGKMQDAAMEESSWNIFAGKQKKEAPAPSVFNDPGTKKKEGKGGGQKNEMVFDADVLYQFDPYYRLNKASEEGIVASKERDMQRLIRLQEIQNTEAALAEMRSDAFIQEQEQATARQFRLEELADAEARIAEMRADEEIAEQERDLNRQFRRELALDTTQRLNDLREEAEIAEIERETERLFQMEQLADTEARLVEMREDAAMRRIEEDIVREYQREEALDFAARFGEEWGRATDRMSAGALAAKGTMDLLHQSIGLSIESLIKGSASGAEAFRQMVVSIGTHIAVEAGWKALMEFAEAVKSAASYDYGAAAQHAASGAMFVAVAAVAGTAAGVANSYAPSSSSGASASHAGQTGYTPSYERPQQGPQQVEVTIKMEEDGWTSIVQKNEQSLRDGRDGFAMAGAA